MLFNSIEFLIFFPIVVFIYLIIPRKTRYLWLLASSYYFYMCWSVKYALLIAFSTLATFLCGLSIDKADGMKNTIGRKKSAVAICCILNLSILFFFKYYGWLLNSIGLAVGKDISMPFSIILPVGISFYTFQALGYVIDVYRGEIKAEKNFLKYALFVSFFPQLVAGPIERSKSLITQIENMSSKRLFSFKKSIDGMILMVWGMFLKLVIADRISIIVDNVFDQYYSYNTMALILAVICFSIQIYCDFASYSTIAVGAAKVMGFELIDNFNTPYFSTSIKEFWQRWHISLSSWLRDYVYISLGGSRRGNKYINIMITFLLSGLWHGANWTYVVWGGIHGAYRIVGDFTKETRKKLLKTFNARTDTVTFKVGQIIVNNILICFAWIFFRSETIKGAIIYIKRIFTQVDPWSLFDQSLYNLGLNRFQFNVLVVALVVLFIVSLIRYFTGKNIAEFLKSQGIAFQWITVIAMVVGIYIFGEYGAGFDAKQFIYFQF